MTSPRQRRQARTREAILQASLALIAEKGLDGFSLREVARRVDYSPAGLYEYFGSKEEILRALAVEGDGRMAARLRAVPRALPPIERLIETCMAYIEMSQRHKEYFMVGNSLSSRRGSLEEEVPRESSYFVLLQAVLAAIDSGDLSTEEDYGPESVTYGVWALMHGMAMLRLTHLRDFEAEFETANRRTLQRFLRGSGPQSA